MITSHKKGEDAMLFKIKGKIKNFFGASVCLLNKLIPIAKSNYKGHDLAYFETRDPKNFCRRCGKAYEGNLGI